MIIITTIITIIIKSRRRVSREIILQILFPRVRTSFLGKLGLVHRIRNQWNSRNIPDTRPSTNERTQISPPIPRLSLSLVPGRKRTIEGARLTGKRPTNSGIKWRFTYGIEAWGWKMRRSTGADVEPSRFFLASIELESRKGLCSIRADFHSYGKSLRVEFSWNCVRLFFFFSFSFVGLLYGWRIESMRRIQFEDLILVGWWKQSKSESFFKRGAVGKENSQVER